MSQPLGFIKEDNKHLVCKLKKLIYGLKKSLKEWYSKIIASFNLKDLLEVKMIQIYILNIVKMILWSLFYMLMVWLLMSHRLG